MNTLATEFRKTGMVPASGMPLLCSFMFIGWYGRAKPSLLAMALSLLEFRYYFVKPIHSLTVAARQIPRLLFFLLAFVSSGIVAQTAVETPRTIRVVVDNAYAPYSFQSNESKLQGILIDQCRWHNRVSQRSYGAIEAELFAARARLGMTSSELANQGHGGPRRENSSRINSQFHSRRG